MITGEEQVPLLYHDMYPSYLTMHVGYVVTTRGYVSRDHADTHLDNM